MFSFLETLLSPRQEQRRAGLATFGSDEGARPFPVTSPEDLVLRKLRWYRQGREASERQWSNVLGVLKVQAGRLDPGYLAHWSSELGVSDLLDRALSEAEA